ncbi:DoxX family protein [Fodinicola feengrottensis]|uniref:DoxX family protein n=1 Tax=Fodinicola feengrottensis TaxID=435914 RepID=UPI0024420825|nr:DoxX family protein [Fodinicola feengrottensis]
MVTDRPTAQEASTARSVGLLVLRLMVGVVLVVHGIPKLANPAAFIHEVAGLGVPIPVVCGSLQIAGEVGLGLALLIGLMSRTAGVLVAVMMGLTWVIVHVPQGLLGKTGISGESAVLLGALPVSRSRCSAAVRTARTPCWRSCAKRADGLPVAFPVC